MQNLSNYGATLAEAEQHLRNLEPFHTGTLSALWSDFDDTSYCVYSYGVLIAEGGYSFTGFIHDGAYDYSKTTSKHANLVKKAWGIN